MKHILILSGSPRVNGNSGRLCDAFAKGAREAGHGVKKIIVAQQNIGGCLGCGSCQRSGGACVLHDDMTQIRTKMRQSDVIVLATPIYYYNVSSQLKALMDRCYAFGRDGLKGKEFCYLISCAAPDESYASTILASLRGYISCFADSREGGYVIACSAVEPRDTKDSAAEAQAYELGRHV